jgi:hypothetical protein
MRRPSNTYSSAQLRVLLGFSSAWLRRHVPRAGNKWTHGELIDWINLHRARPTDPTWIYVPTLYSAAQCSAVFRCGGARTWLNRMRSGEIPCCIRTDSGQYRAPIESIARYIESQMHAAMVPFLVANPLPSTSGPTSVGQMQVATPPRPAEHP